MATNQPGAVDTFSGSHTNSVNEAVNASDINTLQDGLRYVEGELTGPYTYNAKHWLYGAVGNGSTDDATAINAAITAAAAVGGDVYLPAGTYVVGAPLVINSKVRIHGAANEATIIQLKNAANCDVMRSLNFATLTGGNTTGGVNNFTIQDITIDGNKANQTTAGNGISIYGYGYILINVRVRNCFTDGIYSEWSTSSSSPGQDAMEAQYVNVKAHDCTNRGINFFGPHDSQFINTDAYICHRPIHIDAGGAAAGCQLTNTHVWGVTSGGDYSIVLGNGFGSVVNLLAEGGITGQVLVIAGNIVGDGWNCFAGVATPNSVYGITIGDGTHGVAGLQIRASVYECQGGAINLNNDNGSSTFDLVTYLSAGTYVVSAANNTSKLRMLQGGSNGGNFIETGGIGQAWTLASPSFSNKFNFNLANGRLEMLNGSNIRGYSDNFTTQTYNADMSTGEVVAGNFADKSQTGATVLATSGTITPVIGTGGYRMAPTGAVTGIILATLSGHDGTEITIYNESAFTITFAAVATSHVANGVTSVIAANAARSFKWNNAKSLWYPLI